MHKVLILSYFPNLRTLKFVEYLPLYDFKPFLLTAKKPILSLHQSERRAVITKLRYNNIYYCVDIIPFEPVKYLLRKLGMNFRLFFLPDIYITWIPLTFIKALKIIRSREIDLIYVSGGPFSSAIIGALLKKKTRLPFVIDFRDPWTLDHDPSLEYPTKFHKFIDKRIEKFVLDNADYIITATETISNEYFKEYPELKNRTHVITHGFDPNDLPGDCKLSSKFTITYTGTLHGSGYRPYELFFQALYNILYEGKISKKDLQVYLVGAKEYRVIMDIGRYMLERFVIPIDMLPQEKSLEYTTSSHLLLVIELTNAVTTKIYEYLATGKPILAIISKGELEQLIRKNSDNSYIITSGSVDEITAAILDAYKKWKEGDLTQTRPEKQKRYWKKYTRKNLASELAKVLNKLIIG